MLSSSILIKHIKHIRRFFYKIFLDFSRLWKHYTFSFTLTSQISKFKFINICKNGNANKHILNDSPKNHVSNFCIIEGTEITSLFWLRLHTGFVLKFGKKSKSKANKNKSADYKFI